MKIKKYDDVNENKYDKLIRKDGFYWVLFKNDNEWTIGKYTSNNPDGSGINFPWEVVASDGIYTDDDFEEIGEFINPIRKVLKNIWKNN